MGQPPRCFSRSSRSSTRGRSTARRAGSSRQSPLQLPLTGGGILWIAGAGTAALLFLGVAPSPFAAVSHCCGGGKHLAAPDLQQLVAAPDYSLVGAMLGLTRDAAALDQRRWDSAGSKCCYRERFEGRQPDKLPSDSDSAQVARGRPDDGLARRRRLRQRNRDAGRLFCRGRSKRPAQGATCCCGGSSNPSRATRSPSRWNRLRGNGRTAWERRRPRGFRRSRKAGCLSSNSAFNSRALAGRGLEEGATLAELVNVEDEEPVPTRR
jgi:hypothetical protein